MPKRETSELFHMTKPTRYAAAMVLFLIVTGLIALALMDRIANAFTANVFLNGLILLVLLVGIVYSFVQVFRLTPSVRWIENYRMEDLGGLGPQDYAPPELLAPMAAMLRDRHTSTSLSATALTSILDSIGSRLDESRDISRYMIGLLVFLGLLGTFWGLLQTISSVSDAIGALDTTSGGASGQVFEELIAGLQAPLSGMAIAFSSSLFGLSGSLVLGFLDLRAGQAQNRFYNELEEYLSTRTQIGFDDDLPPGGGRRGHSREETLSALYGAARALENAIVNLDTRGELLSEDQTEEQAPDAKIEDLDQHRQTRARSRRRSSRKSPEAVERLVKAVDEDREEDDGDSQERDRAFARALVKHAMANHKDEGPETEPTLDEPDVQPVPRRRRGGAEPAPLLLDTVAEDPDALDDIRKDLRALTRSIAALTARDKD